MKRFTYEVFYGGFPLGCNGITLEEFEISDSHCRYCEGEAIQ